jgi:hypothetical protein
MANHQLPPTEEETWPRTNSPGPTGEPVFLSAFPSQVALRIPKSGEVVGREWFLQAGLSDGKVSREHLRFTRPGGNFCVTDVGSKLGTYVDGYKLEPNKPVSLEDGAILRLGQTILVYREEFDGPLTPQPPLGDLTAPWTLNAIRKKLGGLRVDPRIKMNILLEGPTGAGKELLAREIARVLGRKDHYVRLNISSIPHNLFEGHLFGWQKGVFTGAVESNAGVLGSTHKGAVFFDEIEALPLELQPKLLRYLENREVFPMGAREPIRVDTVVIAATNESLDGKIEARAFRRDMLERFLIRFELPGLEERPEDIFAIFDKIWRHYHGSLEVSQINPEVVELMMRHNWPGNVREIERLVIAADRTAGLNLSLVQRELRIPLDAMPKKAVPLTRESVEHALKTCPSEVKAAHFLGVDRAKLRRWRERNGV